MVILTMSSKVKKIKIVPQSEKPMVFEENIIENIERGNTYLVKESEPNKSFMIFIQLIRSICLNCEYTDSFECEPIDCTRCTLECPCNSCERSRVKGLCISRLHPNAVVKKYPFQTTPLLWLAQDPLDYENSISPTNRMQLISVIKDFLTKIQGGIILLDGIEYLISKSDFTKILDMIQKLTETVSENKGILIIPLHPKALPDNQMAILEREMYNIFEQ